MQTWRNILIGYGSAASFVALAALFRFLLSLIDPNILLFSSFYPAVLVSALLFGPGPGVFSIFVSAAVTWIFFMPHDPFNLARAINLIFFAISGGLIAWIGAAYRSATRGLKAEQERRALLVDELLHRNKNMATVAQSIIHQSLKDGRGSADTINGRLQALFSTNDLLTRSENRFATLADILSDKVTPYGETRVLFSGPHVLLSAAQAQPISLVLHELATNAAKYGALSNEYGSLRIEWTVAQNVLTLHWSEEGGPAIDGQPATIGFGTTLIRSLTAAAGGTIEKTWVPSGMTATLTLPLSAP